MAIIDYGVGNLYSLSSSLRKAGASPTIAETAEQLVDSDAIILPGVGSFPTASRNLKPFRSTLFELILDEKRPVLGICLGMQLLLQESEEGEGKGLEILRGRVVSLPDTVKRPHMGWNTLEIVREDDLVRGVPNGAFAYFNHSYYPQIHDRDLTLAETDYGLRFASIIAKENVYGTQFHPEKSGATGPQILRNFIDLTKR